MRSLMVQFIHRSRYVVFVAALLSGLTLAALLLGGLALAAPSALGDPGNENWMAFSVGVSGGDINALAVDSAGNLYVGGAFTTTTGGVLVTRTAKWDGTTWSPLGDGLTATIRALVVSGTTVYVGGDFPGLVAKWDGATWTTVGSPITGTTVRALSLDNSGNLYAGGDFTGAGICTTGCTGLAKWDGATWSTVGGGISGTTTLCRINGLAFDPVGNNLYAAGQNECNRADPGGVNLTISRVARWNFTASTWSALGAGASSNANSWAVDSKGNAYMAFGGSSVYNTGPVTLTVGRVAKWDPTANAGAGAWFALCNGATCGLPGGTGRAVVVDKADNVYLISDQTTAGGVTTNYIAKWNPNANGGLGAWSALGSGLGQNTPRGLAYRDGNLYVGGGFTTVAGGQSSPRIARWTAAEGGAILGTGVYNFYANNMPVGADVTTQGDLARINIQRFNTNHPSATAQIQTGYYWQIEGLNISGTTATGFSVNLTLPASGFTPDDRDRVCYYTGSEWNCAMDSYNATSITRNGVTSFSDWATGNDIGPLTFPLTVTKLGAGSGLVTSTPQGVDCGVTCTARFESGTAVTLTATPATGSSFGGWGGACLGPGIVLTPETQCVVPMTAAMDVTVTFNKYFIFLPIVFRN